MPKKAAGLTAIAVRQAGSGSYSDGAGLMLLVKETGTATWILRYQLDGKRRDMGLGAARGKGSVGLAEARSLAEAALRLTRQGVDPIAHRAAQAADAAAKAQKSEADEGSKARTFRRVSEAFIASHQASWSNSKHGEQWTSTLTNDAYPHIGDLPIAAIGTPHVLAVLEPIWSTKTETASRIRGRIERILDFARVHGWREGENPARWRGHLSHILPAPSRIAPVEHHPALPWRQVPTFLRALRRKAGDGGRALHFAILTAARSGEVREMTWQEIDFVSAVWTVPAFRMKAREVHRVPLSDEAIDLLRDQLPDDGKPCPTDFVFPGKRKGRPLSDMTLSQLVRGMATDGLEPGEVPRWCDESGEVVVPHGFRSSFRDWAAEATRHQREVAEAALAHTLESKVEGAYQRGDLLDKRRVLMQDWAEFCSRKVELPGADTES